MSKLCVYFGSVFFFKSQTTYFKLRHLVSGEKNSLLQPVRNFI